MYNSYCVLKSWIHLKTNCIIHSNNACQLANPKESWSHTESNHFIVYLSL